MNLITRLYHKRLMSEEWNLDLFIEMKTKSDLYRQPEPHRVIWCAAFTLHSLRARCLFEHDYFVLFEKKTEKLSEDLALRQ